MNQNEVKERLQKLHESTTDYTVIFSGRKNRKVNGLYKIASKEIIIHNKNFANDNCLMFTAIHELAHHIINTETKRKGSRAHTQLFWATFHDLVDKAEAAGIYAPDIDAATRKLIDDVRDISKQIADLQRKLGHMLIRVNEVCGEKGLRYEDVVERKAQISKQTMKTSIAAYNMGDEDVSADIQTEAAKERNEDKRDAILAAGHEGKSVVQAKKTTAPPLLREDETVSLIKERHRIERTIEALTRRLEEVVEQITEHSGNDKNFFGGQNNDL
jgi:hypothetical protein